MRILFSMAAAVALLVMGGPAYAKEASPQSTTTTFVARGQALVWLRGVLNDVRLTEPNAQDSEFQLDITIAGGAGSIDVVLTLPDRPDMFSLNKHRYSAPFSKGVVGPPSLLQNATVPA